MSKASKVFNVAWQTKVENKSKPVFLCFFFLTRSMSFCLRNFPTLGKILKGIFSHLPQPEFIIKNSLGRWSVLPFNDSLTISSDYFEEELKDWPGRATNRRIFIDIGANIGRYTVIAANNFNYSHILSIEANPVTFKILKKNIFLNGIEGRVTAKQTAAGNREGKVMIQSDSDHLGGANIVNQQTGPATMENQALVNITTVDRIFLQERLNAKEVDFVKIDVEGMECEVLEGMTSVLLNMTEGSGLMVEVSNESRVLDFLAKYGFERIESISNDSLFIKQSKPQNKAVSKASEWMGGLKKLLGKFF